MTSETDSTARTRAGYAAFAAGDLEAVRGMFAPDITWHAPGRSQHAGTYRGVDAVLGYFVALFEGSAGTFAAELLDCGEIAPGTVAAHVRMTGTFSAGAVDTELVSIFREDAEGKVVEVLNFSRDQYAIDEADPAIAISLPDARTAATPIRT